MTNLDAILFAKGFIHAFVINLEVAIGSLILGLLAALPLTYVRQKQGLYAWTSETLIAFFRAFPVFVLLYVLFNASSFQFISDAYGNQSVELFVVILALCAYSITAISDAMLDSWKKLDSGDLQLAWLFIPNCFRIFTILILASGIGAAIGLQDSVAFSIQKIDLIEDRVEKIFVLFAVCIFYVVFLSIFKVLLDRVVLIMTRKKTPQISS